MLCFLGFVLVETILQFLQYGFVLRLTVCKFLVDHVELTTLRLARCFEGFHLFRQIFHWLLLAPHANIVGDGYDTTADYCTDRKHDDITLVHGYS